MKIHPTDDDDDDTSDDAFVVVSGEDRGRNDDNFVIIGIGIGDASTWVRRVKMKTRTKSWIASPS